MGYILRVVGGPQDGQVIPIPPDKPVRFGRGKDNDVAVRDSKLSRNHCQVAMIAGKCVITDLASTNGTYVDGERVEERTLSAGESITLGQTTFKVAYREEDAQAPVVKGAAVCAECGKPVTQADLDAGKGSIVGDRTYCADCRMDFAQAAAKEEPPLAAVASQPALELKPGDQFAGYVIGERLRETIYGAQYKATRKQVANPLSLTVLRTSEADWAGKFLQACYQAGALIHPGILMLYETGEEGGRYYYATEYAAAQTLVEILAEKVKLPLNDSFALVDQIAHTLSYSSDKHFPHGTLAPCNIYVKRDGSCKVSDFNLAALTPMRQEDSPYPLALMPYRAPEQLRARIAPTFEADLYALGAVFYQLLTGKPLYQGSTSEEVRDKALAGRATSIKDEAPEVAESIQKIIERCTAASPGGRYQTPKELVYDFDLARHR
jgi:hypothetical protein